MTWSIHLAFEGGPPLISSAQSWRYSLARPDPGWCPTSYCGLQRRVCNTL